MKKEKLKLKHLKIKTFVTTFEAKEDKTIKGGSVVNSCTVYPICSADGCATPYPL